MSGRPILSPVRGLTLPEQELALFVGLQGSGKTSFFLSRLADTHVLVSKDNFPNNRNKARRQRQLIAEALADGRSVVLDNTNPAAEDRVEAIGLARLFGVTVTGYVFFTSVSEALERNRRREGRARVPDVAIFATAARLRAPSLAEGFDALYDVRLLPDGVFDVQPRRSDEGQ